MLREFEAWRTLNIANALAKKEIPQVSGGGFNINVMKTELRRKV